MHLNGWIFKNTWFLKFLQLRLIFDSIYRFEDLYMFDWLESIKFSSVFAPINFALIRSDFGCYRAALFTENRNKRGIMKEQT